MKIVMTNSFSSKLEQHWLAIGLDQSQVRETNTVQTYISSSHGWPNPRELGKSESVKHARHILSPLSLLVQLKTIGTPECYL